MVMVNVSSTKFLENKVSGKSWGGDAAIQGARISLCCHALRGRASWIHRAMKQGKKEGGGDGRYFLAVHN